jgi:hypothetical protein
VANIKVKLKMCFKDLNFLMYAVSLRLRIADPQLSRILDDVEKLALFV